MKKTALARVSLLSKQKNALCILPLQNSLLMRNHDDARILLFAALTLLSQTYADVVTTPEVHNARIRGALVCLLDVRLIIKPAKRDIMRECSNYLRRLLDETPNTGDL